MWNNFNHLDYLVYPLNHQYTPTSLSLQHLKGQDAAKCRYLEALCARNGFYWFLARMTKTTSGESEDYGTDDEGAFTIGRTVIPSGTEMRLGLYSFDKENILTDVDYDNRDSDSENEGEWTGNASMPSEFRCRDTVAIICRKESLVRRLSGNIDHMMSLFELICNDSNCPPASQSMALDAILKADLRQVIAYGDRSTDTYSYGYPAYRPKIDPARAARSLKDFETVVEFCYNLGLGHVVANLLRQELQSKSQDIPQELMRLIALQTAEETAEGKEDVWSS
jgi:hypothetical protein